MEAMKIKATDRIISPGITMSYAAMYGAQYKNRASKVLEVVEHALPVLKELMVLPENLIIRIAPIRQKMTRGRYWNSKKCAEIDCELRSGILETLCHELIHAEQYETGKLAYQGSNVGIWCKSEAYPYVNPSKNYEGYRNLPWEKEAFNNQKMIADIVRENCEWFKGKDLY